MHYDQREVWACLLLKSIHIQGSGHDITQNKSSTLSVLLNFVFMATRVPCLPQNAFSNCILRTKEQFPRHNHVEHITIWQKRTSYDVWSSKATYVFHWKVQLAKRTRFQEYQVTELCWGGRTLKQGDGPRNSENEINALHLSAVPRFFFILWGYNTHCIMDLIFQNLFFSSTLVLTYFKFLYFLHSSILDCRIWKRSIQSRPSSCPKHHQTSVHPCQVLTP